MYLRQISTPFAVVRSASAWEGATAEASQLPRSRDTRRRQQPLKEGVDTGITLKIIGERNSDLVRRAKVVLSQRSDLSALGDGDGPSDTMKIIRNRILVVLEDRRGAVSG
jgi:hypothetical protein